MEKITLSPAARPRAPGPAARRRPIAPLRPAAVGALLAAVLVVAWAPARAQDGKGGARPGAAGSVVVDNRLQRDVSLWVNGRHEGRCGSGETCEIPRVPAGPLQLKATAAEAQGPVASESRTLEPGGTFTWTLYPLLEWGEEKGTGTVVLVNRLDRPVAVSFGERPAGTLEPGATRAYPRVVAGDVEIRVRDADDREVTSRTLSLRAGTFERWEIGAPERTSRGG
jgi:hypothetical protein